MRVDEVSVILVGLSTSCVKLNDSIKSSHTLEQPTGLSTSKLKSPKTIHSFCSRKHFSKETENSDNHEALLEGGL